MNAATLLLNLVISPTAASTAITVKAMEISSSTRLKPASCLIVAGIILVLGDGYVGVRGTGVYVDGRNPGALHKELYGFAYSVFVGGEAFFDGLPELVKLSYLRCYHKVNDVLFVRDDACLVFVRCKHCLVLPQKGSCIGVRVKDAVGVAVTCRFANPVHFWLASS